MPGLNRTLVPACMNIANYCVGKRLSIRSWTFSKPTNIAAIAMALSRSAALVIKTSSTTGPSILDGTAVDIRIGGKGCFDCRDGRRPTMPLRAAHFVIVVIERNLIFSSCPAPPGVFTLPRMTYEQRILTSSVGPKSGFPSARFNLNFPLSVLKGHQGGFSNVAAFQSKPP